MLIELDSLYSKKKIFFFSNKKKNKKKLYRGSSNIKVKPFCVWGSQNYNTSRVK